jgi:hypothetical protein
VAVVTDTTRFPFDVGVDVDETAARRTLREQIARLEGELADAFATAFPRTEVDVRVPAPARRGPRVLSLGDLEAQRDALQDRLRETRARLEERGEREERGRIALEKMLADPRRHKWARLHRADIGQGGCGAYQVRPRLGLVGMLAGWWHVKLSSGCPLATS